MKITKKPLYVFIHIPKTGGTTITQHIRKNIEEKRILALYPKPDKKDFQKTIEELTKEKKDDLYVIFGHSIFFGIHKYFPNRETRYIVFLRNPIKIQYSNYNYLMGLLNRKRVNIAQEKKLLSDDGKILTFDEYLQINKNVQSRFLVNQFKKEPKIKSNEMIDIAKKLLDKMYFVGITENNDDFEKVFNILGISNLFKKENISKKYITENDLLNEKIINNNKIDLEIYNYAIEINKKQKNMIKHNKIKLSTKYILSYIYNKIILKIKLYLNHTILPFYNKIVNKKQKNKRILIIGTAKTGTTMLLYKIKHSLPYKPDLLFEPKEYIEKPSDKNTGVLSKIILKKDTIANYDSWKCFDKKILIIRDPRDTLISGLLYSIRDSKFYMDKDKFNFFLNKLIQKENDPKSVTLTELLKLRRAFNTGKEIISDEEIKVIVETNFSDHIPFKNSDNKLFLIKYENIIDNKISDLERYLGVKLRQKTEVAKDVNRVARTKGYGSWRDWFTEEDVILLKSVFEKYMKEYNYDFTDWKLNDEQKILPEHCSKYVEKIVNERLINEVIKL